MCECGCVANDRKYWFPGPSKTIYVLTLSAGCVDCDASSGVSIEVLKPGDFMYSKIKQDEYSEGPLEFEKWGDAQGIGIITGLRRHEFVAKCQSHLIGVSSEEMGEGGKIDEAGADVILEEMFEDSVVEPHFPKREQRNL